MNGAAQSHFGIGLWIVRRNVEAIGGRVWAENGEDRGLKVTMRLPLAN
jgi:two-component system sensor histidine kinase ChvG